VDPLISHRIAAMGPPSSQPQAPAASVSVQGGNTPEGREGPGEYGQSPKLGVTVVATYFAMDVEVFAMLV
jgi:hypothetical protein